MSYKRPHHERDAFPHTPRNIRLDAGLTTQDIATMTARPVSVIGRLETQRSNPQAFTLALFYAACGRADLAMMLSTVLDDDKVDDVLVVYERWEERYGPFTEFGRLLSRVKEADAAGAPNAPGLRRRLRDLGRYMAAGAGA